MVRLMLLERFLQQLAQLHNVGGVQAIPYMQVVLMLTSDLDGEDEKDKGALDDLLAQLIAELGMHKKVIINLFMMSLNRNVKMFYSVHAIAPQDVSKKNERSSINEVHLVIMRLLSVFMSRTKSGSKSSEVRSLFDFW